MNMNKSTVLIILSSIVFFISIQRSINGDTEPFIQDVSCNDLEVMRFNTRIVSESGDSSTYIYDALNTTYDDICRYGRPYCLQTDATNGMIGYWAVNGDNAIERHDLNCTLFVLELNTPNTSRSVQDVNVVCMKDLFYMKSYVRPTMYICMGPSGGNMTISNTGCKALFSIKNKYVGSNHSESQDLPISSISTVQMFWRGTEGRKNGQDSRVSFIRGTKFIGTGLESPTQFAYIRLYGADG